MRSRLTPFRPAAKCPSFALLPVSANIETGVPSSCYKSKDQLPYLHAEEDDIHFFLFWDKHKSILYATISLRHLGRRNTIPSHKDLSFMAKQHVLIHTDLVEIEHIGSNFSRK